MSCVACSTPSSSGRESNDALLKDATARLPTIRMEIPAAPDVADVPRLMMRDALQKAGYTIEALEFRDQATTVQALLNGQLDVAEMPFTQVLAAMQRGAAISQIMSRGSRVRVLVSAPEIKMCADLNGQQVSLPGVNSTQELSLRRYVQTRCPGTRIEPLVISRVENRMTGLLTRRTGAAVLDLASMLRVQKESGGAYNVLSVFGVDFPDLIEGTFAASRAFLDSHPESARAIVRELIIAMRKIQDSAVLEREITTRLGLPRDEAVLLAKTYLENKVWDVNGGLSLSTLQANIDFAVASGVIEPGVTASHAADLSYLEAVLAEIGRQ